VNNFVKDPQSGPEKETIMNNEDRIEDRKSKEKIKREKARDEVDANPDPLTGEPGSHPVGTGIGAATAGAVGAVVGGVVAGPIGAVAGGAIGAVAGGLAGHGAGEAVNPTEEYQYWKEHYRSRPYVKKGAVYDEYSPAYEYGWMAHGRYEGKTFEEVEPDLKREWESMGDKSRLSWDEARPAAHESWERVEARRRQSELPRTGTDGGL
jgi:hypothetical protein